MSDLSVLFSTFTKGNEVTLKQDITVENTTLHDIDIEGATVNDINTSGTLRAVSGKGFIGEVPINWRRLRLESMFYLIPVIVRNNTVRTTVELARLVEGLYQVGISDSDIIDREITVSAPRQEILIEADPTSIKWCGFLTVVVINPTIL